MKKIIIFLTILISSIFSNVAFADFMVPWENCYSYDKNCYNECLKNWKYKTAVYEKKWFCKRDCCIKKKIKCEKPFYFYYCDIKWEVYPICKYQAYWDCTESKNIIKIIFEETDASLFWLFRPSEFYILLIIILFVWIFIYKKSKKW